MANDEPADEIEEFEIPDDEADYAIAPDAERRASLVAASSLIASIILFAGALYRTVTRGGMVYHTLPDSILTIRIMMVVGVVVVLLGAHALKVTRPFEGKLIRGVAVAGSALSFVAELLLGTSLHELLALNNS